MSHFWNYRWRKEYLANLREFHKCKSGKREREAEVGDVVVVYEEERKRGEWKMGVRETGEITSLEELLSESLRRENRFSFPDQFKNFIRWSFGAKGRE